MTIENKRRVNDLVNIIKNGNIAPSDILPYLEYRTYVENARGNASNASIYREVLNFVNTSNYSSHTLVKKNRH